MYLVLIFSSGACLKVPADLILCVKNKVSHLFKYVINFYKKNIYIYCPYLLSKMPSYGHASVHSSLTHALLHCQISLIYRKIEGN
jgi:hypothetical protein